MKILSSLLFIGLAAAAVAEPAEGPPPRAFAATPATAPDWPQRVPLWLPATAAFETNLPRRQEADSFSGETLCFIYPENATQEFFARYRFDIAQEQPMLFYAAMGHQGTSYVSPVEFQFDDDGWRRVPVIAGPRYAWGVSSAVDWEFLGEHAFKPGEHTLSFRVDQKAPNGNWSVIFDGIFAVSTEAYRAMHIENLSVETADPAPGGKLDFRFDYSCDGEEVPAEAQLLLGNAVAGRLLVYPHPGENRCTMPLHPNLGANTYRLRISPVTDAGIALAECSVRIGKLPTSDQAALPLTGGSLEVTGADFTATLAAPAGADGEAALCLFIDDVLYAVEPEIFAAGATQLSGTVPDAMRQLAAGRDRVVYRLMGQPGDGAGLATAARSVSGNQNALPLPMNYGDFVDRAKTHHFWYISHAGEYVFDGAAYHPVGGMWCPETLLHQTEDVRTIADHLAHDRKTLDDLAAYGIDDVYLNMSHVAPRWLAQYLIDYLESRGICYGYQGGVGASTVPSYFITRPNDKGGWQPPLEATYRDGAVTLSVPKSYKVSGFLLIGAAQGERWCRSAAFEDTVGHDSRHHIIDLEKVQDFEDRRTVSFRIDLPEGADETLTAIPLLSANMHHVDLWNPEVMQRTLDAQKWYGDIEWGPHFRFIVDPIENETNMVNTSENLRQYTPGLNAAFADWLKLRYGTLETLRRKWDVEAPDFATAARLIPLRDGDRLLLADPETGVVYTAALDRSFAWIDYNTMIRETYADLTDQVAQYIKTLVDVPVIYKSVGVIGEKMSMSKRYLGCDGVGFEIYLNGGIPGETGGGASKAEAEASSHTMWKVGTEVGHSFEVGNGGVKFFTDEAEIRRVTQDLLDLGVKGFYFFGLDLKPAGPWDNHNTHDFPTGLSWMRGIERDWKSGVLAAHPMRKLYSFPEGNTYWWWGNRHTVVYDAPPSVFVRSQRSPDSPDEWYASVAEIPADFDEVVINCPDAPFSAYCADEIDRAVASGASVIYLGARHDLGAIPAIDRYYTGEVINFADGSTAQVLNPGAAEVLAAENGKPWAIRSGNLTILSRTPKKANEFLTVEDFFALLKAAR